MPGRVVTVPSPNVHREGRKETEETQDCPLPPALPDHRIKGSMFKGSSSVRGPLNCAGVVSDLGLLDGRSEDVKS